jgi:hypothetical protein
MLDEFEICFNSTNAVEPQFFISAFYVFLSFTYFFVWSQINTHNNHFSRFYAILDGPHKIVKSGFYSACFT